MIEGIVDLSHWQAPVDFPAMKAGGVLGVILKATQGIDYVDPTFAPRAAAAASAGLLVGAYHFFDGSAPLAQADAFWRIAKGTPLLALDFEPNPTSGMLEQNAETIVTGLKSLNGSWPALYTGRWEIPVVSSILQQCPLWLAEYGTTPIPPPGWVQWKIWQYTDGTINSNGSGVPGVGGKCDRDRFNGTVDDLVSWWNA